MLAWWQSLGEVDQEMLICVGSYTTSNADNVL
jgi:hypothetical protein